MTIFTNQWDFFNAASFWNRNKNALENCSIFSQQNSSLQHWKYLSRVRDHGKPFHRCRRFNDFFGNVGYPSFTGGAVSIISAMDPIIWRGTCDLARSLMSTHDNGQRQTGKQVYHSQSTDEWPCIYIHLVDDDNFHSFISIMILLFQLILPKVPKTLRPQ